VRGQCNNVLAWALNRFLESVAQSTIE
jgi:hypothetical protein